MSTSSAPRLDVGVDFEAELAQFELICSVTSSLDVACWLEENTLSMKVLGSSLFSFLSLSSS